MSSLASREKQYLLEIARRALILAVEQDKPLEDIAPESAVANLSRSSGAFVTLRRARRLRGCIGQLACDVPLIHVIAYCARAAALSDPRFDPVVRSELGEIDIELSILSAAADVKVSEIVPGRHGIIVSQGSQRGLLLPQVATEFSWSAERLLAETCIKGGISPDAWKHEQTRIQAFTAEVFSEASLRNLTKEPASPAHRGADYSSST